MKQTIFVFICMFSVSTFAAEKFSVSGEAMIAAAAGEQAPAVFNFAKRHDLRLNGITEVQIDGSRVWIAGQELKKGPTAGTFTYQGHKLSVAKDKSLTAILEDLYRQLGGTNKVAGNLLFPAANAADASTMLTGVGIILMITAVIVAEPALLTVAGISTGLGVLGLAAAEAKHRVPKAASAASCDAKGIHVRFEKGFVNVKLVDDSQVKAQVMGADGEINLPDSRALEDFYAKNNGATILRRCALHPVSSLALVHSVNTMLSRAAKGEPLQPPAETSGLKDMGS